MEFISVDIQPLSVVDNIGFRRLINSLQPRYKLPSRWFFTNTLMPDMVELVKVIKAHKLYLFHI